MADVAHDVTDYNLVLVYEAGAPDQFDFVQGYDQDGTLQTTETDGLLSIGDTVNAGWTYVGIVNLEGVDFYAAEDGTVRYLYGVWPGGTIHPPPTLHVLHFQQTAVPLCFAAGTLIATPDGEVAVETLAIGDRVLTADGRAIPVKWIGRQTLHRRFTPEEKFRPVRLCVGALGENLPHVELVLTADHGLVLDGVIVQAGVLVNGSTIQRVPMADLGEREVYFHVETEDHEVILAAGVTVETFVDNASRRRFDNFQEYLALYGPETGAMAEIDAPRVMSVRQLPASLRAMIERRAAA